MATWRLTAPYFTIFQDATDQPTAYSVPYDIFTAGTYYPLGTTIAWVEVISGASASDEGWWLSSDKFATNSSYLHGSIPQNPRGWTETAVFSASSAAALGGFPGVACTLNNYLVYAPGGYTVGTDSPSIRIWNGVFDREVVKLPNTTANVVPKAVMTMLTTNGTIYLTTFDSGTTSANWSGRVFELDIVSGHLEPIGTAFPAGHMPYALAWNMGRLWCGTNRQVSTATGKIYYFRPNVDTAWTEDRDLTSDSMAGVASLYGYNGYLYIGCTSPVGSFAKLLVRSSIDGSYSTADTGTGGTARANNGFYAITTFASDLYYSFWNPDTPTAVSKIKKLTGTATVYTGASATIKPYIALPTDDTTLLAVGGGVGYAAALLSTTDGSSWTDRTANIVSGYSGIPAFGTIIP